MIIGVDPGPTHSAFAIVDSSCAIIDARKVTNEAMRSHMRCYMSDAKIEAVCIESITSYGAPVGRSTFETCMEIGRLLEICEEFGAARVPVHLYPRQEYANAICGTTANDAKLRQALLLRFGGDKKGEALHALKGATDLRSAYAVAVYHLDRCRWEAKRK